MQTCLFELDGVRYEFSPSKALPIYSPIAATIPLECFGLGPAAASTVYRCESDGSGCNCERITLCPHANCTHIETERHVAVGGRSASDVLQQLPPLIPSLLVRLSREGTMVDDTPQLEMGCGHVQAVVLHTGWLHGRIAHGQYNQSLSGAPHLKGDLIATLFGRFPGLKILVVDLPSVDPESDSGALLAHRAFFRLGGLSIVELADIPESGSEPGVYLMSLNAAVFDSDASPCSPILYPVQRLFMLCESCIFCKIIKGAIPSHKLLETPRNYAFLDINPLSEGHALIIPKFHGARLADIPDEYLAEAGPLAKKIASAIGCENYNVLQNNGRLAHQEVEHVHFHVIPKPNASLGLGVKWPTQPTDHAALGSLAASLAAKLLQP